MAKFGSIARAALKYGTDLDHSALWRAVLPLMNCTRAASELVVTGIFWAVACVAEASKHAKRMNALKERRMDWDIRLG